MQNTKTFVQRYTGAGAIAETFTPDSNLGSVINIHQVKLTLSAVGANGDTFTTTIVSAVGAAYNGKLVSQDMTGLDTFLDKEEPPAKIPSGDGLSFAWPNSTSLTWGLEITYSGSY